MKTLLDDQDTYVRELVHKTAEEFGVLPQGLWQMYCRVMDSNLEQDLWDIAKENLEDLKEVYTKE